MHSGGVTNFCLINSGDLVELCQSQWHEISHQIEILFVIWRTHWCHSLNARLLLWVKMLFQIDDIRIATQFLEHIRLSIHHAFIFENLFDSNQLICFN